MAAVGCLLQADNSCAQANQAQAAGLPSHSRVSRVPPATDSFLSYIPVHSSKAYMSAPPARARARCYRGRSCLCRSMALLSFGSSKGAFFASWKGIRLMSSRPPSGLGKFLTLRVCFGAYRVNHLGCRSILRPVPFSNGLFAPKHCNR